MNIEQQMKRHNDAVGKIYPYARKVIFWSFISIFIICGDISIRDANVSATLFGVQISNFTQKKLLFILLVMTIYCGTKFAFSVVRNGIIANSWSVFKNNIFTTDFDKGCSDAEIQQIEQNINSIKGGTTHLDGGSIDLSDPKKEHEDKRKLLLLMKRYNIIGFIEYFFAPIIFPTFLLLWASIILVKEVFF